MARIGDVGAVGGQEKGGGVVKGVGFANVVGPPKKARGGHWFAPATVARLVDAITYAVKKVGVDHVGIASDFNHGGGVAGWNNEGECQNVTAELLRHGYSEGDIAKLWGGNFLRVWGEAQSAGKRR